jgi:hypothetical protein
MFLPSIEDIIRSGPEITKPSQKSIPNIQKKIKNYPTFSQKRQDIITTEHFHYNKMVQVVESKHNK